MATFIDNVFDKIGNIILPKTVTKAVWGQTSGNRLDQELDGIEAALAQPNTGVNADSAYSAGKYIYHVKNKELYKAKSNIASGAAFNKASGGNVDVVKIGDQLQTISSDLAKLNGIEIYNNQSQSGQAAGDISLSGSWQGYNFLTIEFSYSNTDNNYASVTVPSAAGMIAHLFCAYPTSDMLYAAARMVTIKNYNTLTVGQGYLYIGNMTSNADNNAAKVRRVYAHN